MTRKYIYIHSEGNPSRVTSFFIVMLGDSQRDITLKRQLEGQRLHYGDYFKPYDADQWEFVKKCVKSIFDSDDMVTIAQQVVKVSPSALVAYLRGADKPQNPLHVVRNAVRLQCKVSLDTRVSFEMAGKRRKNGRGDTHR